MLGELTIYLLVANFLYCICAKNYEKRLVGIEQNHFVWKTDEIAKFSILDGTTEFTILDGIWTKNGQMTNRSLKNCQK